MKEFITRLQNLIQEVPKKIAQIPVSEMMEKTAPGKWSKREIMGHLCDSALHNLQRFLYAQNIEEPLKITPYPQVELVELNGYQGLPTHQIVSLWASLNTQIVSAVKLIPEEKLNHPVQLPDGAPTYSSENAGTLRWLIEDYLVHMEHHFRQIFPNENFPKKDLPKNWHMSIAEAKKALAEYSESDILLTLLEHGKMYTEIYAPNKIDRQLAHEQDELYVVISGTGTFYCDGNRRPFSPGDLIFVPAGIEHRFEDFSDDFSTWVIFY